MARWLDAPSSGAGKAPPTPPLPNPCGRGDGTSFRVAVNVESQEFPTEQLYVVNENFEHPGPKRSPNA
jgi:uncharacterized protein YukJ